MYSLTVPVVWVQGLRVFKVYGAALYEAVQSLVARF